MSVPLWKEPLDVIREKGRRIAEEMRSQGKKFRAYILVPRRAGAGEKVDLSGSSLKLDEKLAIKLEMVELSRDLMTYAHIVGTPDPALPIVLKAVINETGLFEHSVGEFWLLYGRFEKKYDVSKNKETREKMMEHIKDRKTHLVKYKERGLPMLVPLPYAVRNVLGHGKNTNKIKEGDIKSSIDLLKAWI